MTYDVVDYPEATAMLDSSLVICDARHPIFVQPLELIEWYADTTLRVIGDPERFLGEVAGPPAVPA